MRTIPVDLILHSLLDLLIVVPVDTLGTYAEAIERCIDHRRVAEEWQADGDPATAADWLRRRLNQRDTPTAGFVDKDTRAIEVAVARRLADTAFALCIEQTAEATAHATTLLRAAQAIVGLPVADVGALKPDAGPREETVAPTFKLGDKVRVARAVGNIRWGWRADMDKTVGMRGVVMHCDSLDDTSCRVRFPDGEWFYYATSALDHA